MGENAGKSNQSRSVWNGNVCEKNAPGFNAGRGESSGLGIASQTHSLVALPPVPAIKPQ